MKLWPKTFKGEHILEVWDIRLSTAEPHIFREGTWKVKLFEKNKEDGAAALPLDEYDTGIQVEPGDIWDKKKIKACFKWLYSQRDKYSLPNIEELKPHAAKINEVNKAMAAAVAGYNKTLSGGGK